MKIKSDYGHVMNAAKEAKRKKAQEVLNLPENPRAGVEAVVNRESKSSTVYRSPWGFLGGLLAINGPSENSNALVSKANTKSNADANNVRALLPSRANLLVKPTWHAPWKLYRVISGHTGWVRAVDVEPNNEWFATGGADRIIKV